MAEILGAELDYIPDGPDGYGGWTISGFYVPDDEFGYQSGYDDGYAAGFAAAMAAAGVNTGTFFGAFFGGDEAAAGAGEGEDDPPDPVPAPYTPADPEYVDLTADALARLPQFMRSDDL